VNGKLKCQNKKLYCGFLFQKKKEKSENKHVDDDIEDKEERKRKEKVNITCFVFCSLFSNGELQSM